MATKQSWPELVGKTGEDAKAAILADEPGLTVHIVPQFSPCTMDYREDRVRVFVDNDGKVVNPPMIG